MWEATVGSSKQCDVKVAHDYVSRLHCKLIYQDNEVWIEDLGSSNGTYVNGSEIRPGRRVRIDPTSTVVLAREIKIDWDEIRAYGPAKRKKTHRPSKRKASRKQQNRRRTSKTSGKKPKPKKKLKVKKHSRAQRKSESSSRSGGSIIGAIFVMFIVSLLLFWLPFLGAIIAGYAGGKTAGGVGKAVVAALLPGIIFAFLIYYFIGMISGIPLIGAVAGIGAAVVVLSHVGPLLLGAIIGGAVAN